MDKTRLSPAMMQYLNMKEKYADCILFFRLGDFYEMFFDDAELCSKELGITLTSKNCGTEEKAPMCGVPFHSYESYVAKLLSKGYKVAICEQLTEPGRKLVERDVVRVITPGTIVDSSMLDETENCYVMSVYRKKDKASYAYADISTGEFFVGESKGDKLDNYLNDQIVRVMPAEIICNEEMLLTSSNLPVVKSNSCAKFQQYFEWAFNYASSEKEILNTYNINTLKGYDFDDEMCVITIGALLQYIKETQKRDLKHLTMPRYIHDDQFMYIDTNTRRNLEIDQTMRDGVRKGSLLWVLDKTQTGGGARCLRKIVNQPLQDIKKITQRLDIVDAFKNNAMLRASLIQEFKNIRDIERIVGRLSYGIINPRECVAIKETIEHTPHIKDILLNSDNSILINLAKQIGDFEDLRMSIFKAIADEPPQILKDGGYIKDGYSKELDILRDMTTNSGKTLREIENRERESTGIKSLRIGYNRVFGYYIEVNKQYSEQVPFNYVRKQTISNNERYITQELKEFEEKALTSEEQSLKLEQKLFNDFKQEIMHYCTRLQELAQIISHIDAFLSLAIVAEENNYVRPKMTTDNLLNIKQGRHPVIEKMLKTNSFISNDCLLDGDDNRTMILTGPNMAGKSTYMRQIALITLMAHIGSFVPAQEATICIVDRIFTRIGASDDLAVGQSTFMVEMVEVSNILRFATNKSLIILDEVGRGTSTHDGLSIAWSVVEYLGSHLTCKTLFATHYHELMQLEGKLKGVKNYCLAIKEIGGEIVFLRTVMRGSSTRSYGVEVASLAGLPQDIVSRAKVILQQLENGENIEITKDKPTQIKTYPEVIDILKHCDINQMTPMVAFDTLIRLTELINK